MAEDQIALVTGANRGIGLEVARQLGGLGYMVWLGARDVEKGEAAVSALRAGGGRFEFQPLDVASDQSVSSAARRIEEVSGRLNVLVNNAGIALDSNTPPSLVNLQVVRATFDVNLFGCIRVTQAFLPLLRKSAAARIVMVSSDMGSQTHQTDPAFAGYDLNPMGYISSKAALNAVTIAFAKELRETAVKVNAANPGFTATELNDYRGFYSVQQGAAPIVGLATLAGDGPTGTFVGPEGPEPW